MSHLFDVLDPPSSSSSSPFTLGEMETIARAVVEAVALEEKEGGVGGWVGGGEAVFPLSSPLVTTQCPEFSVLYGCRLALSRLLGQGTHDDGGETTHPPTSSLSSALSPLLSTLPPLGGVAPKRLWPPILQACLSLLQTATRDDEGAPQPTHPPPILTAPQVAALLTCLSEERVNPRRKEWVGGLMGDWRQGRRETLALALGRAFVEERRVQARVGGEGGGGGGGGGEEKKEAAVDLLGPPMV